MDSGWIKISRSLREHWLWSDARRLKWWLDLLLSANYTEKKVLIGKTLIVCGRGQCVKSLETWASEWRVTKKTVKDFFDTLKRDSMLETENMRVTTRITICNYESYQDLVNESETPRTLGRKRERPLVGNANDPQHKKVKKEKNIVMPFSSENFSQKWNDWLDYRKSEFKSVYKSESSEQAALKHLENLSNGNEGKAISIIDQSIANTWRGFFALKELPRTVAAPLLFPQVKSPEQILAERKSKAHG